MAQWLQNLWQYQPCLLSVIPWRCVNIGVQDRVHTHIYIRPSACLLNWVLVFAGYRSCPWPQILRVLTQVQIGRFANSAWCPRCIPLTHLSCPSIFKRMHVLFLHSDGYLVQFLQIIDYLRAISPLQCRRLF